MQANASEALPYVGSLQTTQVHQHNQGSLFPPTPVTDLASHIIDLKERMAHHKPPFTLQTAHEKVKAAQALWNTRYESSFSSPKTPENRRQRPTHPQQRPSPRSPRLHPHIHLAQPQHLPTRPRRNQSLPHPEMGA